MKMLLIAVLLLTGCSTCNHPQWDMDPEFYDYAAQFYLEWDLLKGVTHPVADLSIRFAPQKELSAVAKNAVGVCDFDGNIKILRSFWDKSSPSVREILIFHEMGHCVLGKKHTKKVFACPEVADGCAKSVMFPIILSAKEYVAYRSYYMRELFSHR